MPDPIPFKQFLKKINSLPDPNKHTYKDFLRYVDDIDTAIEKTQFSKIRFQLLSKQNQAIIKLLAMKQ